jgi:hypothetical protein
MKTREKWYICDGKCGGDEHNFEMSAYKRDYVMLSNLTSLAEI